MEFDPEKIRQLETLLQCKSYQKLTPGERALVLEMVESESEYNKLRKVEDSLTQWYGTSIESLEPSPGVLPFLERKLSAENLGTKKASSGIIRSIFNYKVPLSAAVVAWFIIGLVFWWFGDKEPQIVEKPIIVELPVIKVDTLYIDTAPDTLYLEKVIYRDASHTLDIHTFNAVTDIDELASIDLLAVKSGLPISADSVLQRLIVTDY